MNAASSNHFYVTLFSNSSSDFYKYNTLSAFTIKLAQPKVLNYAEKWEVAIFKEKFPPLLEGTGVPMITVGNTHFLVYWNVVAPQYIGGDMVRCLRTFIFPSTTCENLFHKVYCVPVEQRKFQWIWIEFIITNGKRVPFKDNKVPTKIVLHLRKRLPWWVL